MSARVHEFIKSLLILFISQSFSEAFPPFEFVLNPSHKKEPSCSTLNLQGTWASRLACDWMSQISRYKGSDSKTVIYSGEKWSKKTSLDKWLRRVLHGYSTLYTCKLAKLSRIQLLMSSRVRRKAFNFPSSVPSASEGSLKP